MISWPTNAAQKEACRELFRLRCGAAPAEDAHYLVWLKDGQPEWFVAFDHWVGHTCQISQAATHTRPFPRQLVKAVFQYAFDVLHRKMIFAVVDEENEPAMRMDRFLGFREEKRWPGMATSGGDLVLLSITREQCRFLETKQ